MITFNPMLYPCAHCGGEGQFACKITGEPRLGYSSWVQLLCKVCGAGVPWKEIRYDDETLMNLIVRYNRMMNALQEQWNMRNDLPIIESLD